VPARTSPSAAAWAARLMRVRWVVRAPVWLYRARLGFVFGPRLLMLEHTGRKTGILRYAVLEPVDHPDPGTYVVAAGFGNRAQIYSDGTSLPTIALDLADSRPGGAP